MTPETTEKAVATQTHQLQQATRRMWELDRQLAGVESTRRDNRKHLEALDADMAQMFEALGLKRDAADLDKVPSAVHLTDAERADIEARLQPFRELETLPFTTWEAYTAAVNRYIADHQIDLSLDPVAQMLTPGQYVAIEQAFQRQFQTYTWDKWDYIFTGAAGILAAVTDFLLVKIPRSFAATSPSAWRGQTGSPITAWLKTYNSGTGEDWFASWTRELEVRCKVPYDGMTAVINDRLERIGGMSPRSHRLQSLGHDPVLGFVFGVLDILRGTITGFSYDHLHNTHTLIQGAVWTNLAPVGLIEAFLIQLGHLISDVATPMGLPAPLMTLFQGINTGSFGDKERTIGQIARFMYLNGYDFRHFLVTGITPAVVEMVLRAYILLRHYSEQGEVILRVGSHPKYRSMLLCAHAVAAAANLGKISLYQGNPLAINYAQWLALFRYLVPSLKYWLHDKPRQVETLYTARWEDLLQALGPLHEHIGGDNHRPIHLGNC